ncbi:MULTISPECIES: hypothetical protein [unclassified Rhodococcus (in: high G+C Gram-positive bacteria)]|uniref:hypothetical protein n=1 Tax=unclassified Rhodococcus (in: high G+C Gram-positive bacteria) TaxID=192944 RepID=UPI0007C72D9A|nr:MULTISPECIES: hypothetical protein [unclassified Rhodococcus (in: high G+C Gram-positive bacteria)]PBC58061.1 hypothetical protein CJ177_09675 [Rhodococcus sp. ACPA1]RYY51176.1 MAG: hypothetical protein EON53_01780 [Actinomycetales bacterium]
MDRDRQGFPADERHASEANRVRLRTIVDHVRPRRLWHGHFHHRHQAILVTGIYRTVVDGLGRDKGPIDNNMVVVNGADLGWHRATGPRTAQGGHTSRSVRSTIDLDEPPTSPQLRTPEPKS